MSQRLASCKWPLNVQSECCVNIFSRKSNVAVQVQAPNMIGGPQWRLSHQRAENLNFTCMSDIHNLKVGHIEFYMIPLNPAKDLESVLKPPS